MVVAFHTLDFADQVALNVWNGVFTDNAVLSPLVQVPAIEARVESLRQEVHIDTIIFEQVKHIKRSDSRHIAITLFQF